MPRLLEKDDVMQMAVNLGREMVLDGRHRRNVLFGS